jgi:hypothetical protein
MLVNRVGDFGLALGIMACFCVFQTVDFGIIFACASAYAEPSLSFVFCNTKVHALTLICLLLFIGAVGKSAQIGLHTWLPLAMEGLRTDPQQSHYMLEQCAEHQSAGNARSTWSLDPVGSDRLGSSIGFDYRHVCVTRSYIKYNSQ